MSLFSNITHGQTLLLYTKHRRQSNPHPSQVDSLSRYVERQDEARIHDTRDVQVRNIRVLFTPFGRKT